MKSKRIMLEMIIVGLLIVIGTAISITMGLNNGKEMASQLQSLDK